MLQGSLFARQKIRIVCKWPGQTIREICLCGLGPLWGFGLLGVAPRWQGLNLGVDLQYAGWYAEVESLKYNKGFA